MNGHTWLFAFYFALLFLIAGAFAFSYGPPAMAWTLIVSGLICLIANLAAIYTARWINSGARNSSRQ